MTLTASAVYFDPFDLDIKANPYGIYRRLRDEAPLYYNEPHDFYLVSRFDDVLRFFNDRTSFISSKGMTIDQIRAGLIRQRGRTATHPSPRCGLDSVHSRKHQRTGKQSPRLLCQHLQRAGRRGSDRPSA